MGDFWILVGLQDDKILWTSSYNCTSYLVTYKRILLQNFHSRYFVCKCVFSKVEITAYIGGLKFIFLSFSFMICLDFLTVYIDLFIFLLNYGSFKILLPRKYLFLHYFIDVWNKLQLNFMLLSSTSAIEIKTSFKLLSPKEQTLSHEALRVAAAHSRRNSCTCSMKLLDVKHIKLTKRLSIGTNLIEFFTNIWKLSSSRTLSL